MTTETSPAVTEFVEGLNTIRKEYKQLKNGYNEGLYDVLQQSGASIETLQNKPKLRAKVLKKIGERKNRDLALTVVTFITRAKTNGAKKRASKFALALTYLTDVKKVAVDDIAQAIKDAGGIEKLARSAATETPKTKRRRVEKSTARDKTNDEVAPEVEVEDSAKERKQGTSRVNLTVTTALTKKLSKVRVGRKVRLTCRVDDLDDGIGLTITNVALIKEARSRDW